LENFCQNAKLKTQKFTNEERFLKSLITKSEGEGKKKKKKPDISTFGFRYIAKM
jgi:hypothetical protein